MHGEWLCVTRCRAVDTDPWGAASKYPESMSETVFTTARNYLDLTKPRLLPMVLFTGLPVLGMAAGGWPSFTLDRKSVV